jgi:hypothetical protein
MKREIESGSMREVRHDHSIWVTGGRRMRSGTQCGNAYQVSLCAREVQ